MAELATPSAATMATSGTGIDQAPPTKSKPQAPKTEKPEKPDEEAYKKDLAKAEKDHTAAQQKLNAVKAKLDLAKPANKDSPSAKRQADLRSQLSTIRQQQQGLKGSRSSTMEKIKKLDEQLKSRINEQKTARSKLPYKSVDDVDREIQRLQKQVDTGTMKLVDEKKALAEVSQLNKQRKSFAGFDQSQKGIDDVKAQITELRKQLDDPESKGLSDKYTEITKELDSIKAEQDEAFKNLNALRDERTAAHAEQQEKYSTMKDIKDKYYQAKRAYADYDREAFRQRKEKQRKEREEYEAGKRRQIAQQRLEEASAPAYGDEIRTAEGLIRHFDPNSVEAKQAASPGQFAASAQRTVDESGLKGTRLPKKGEEVENYFIGGGGKKKKPGKRSGAAESPAPSRLNLNIGIIEELAKINVEPPSSQDEVPGVVEKLKAKLAEWKKDQDRKTKENIAKAEKEIEKLEAEATGPSNTHDDRSKDLGNKPAAANEGVNGNASASAELAQEKDADADVDEDMKKIRIEDAGEQKAADEGVEA